MVFRNLALALILPSISAFVPVSRHGAPRPLAFVSSQPESHSALNMIIDGRKSRFNSTLSSSQTALQYANAVEVAEPPHGLLELADAAPAKKKNGKAKEKKLSAKAKRKEASKDKAKCYPHRQELLTALSMLPKVTEAKGNYFYLEDGTKVLDCLAQYGAVPLGHNNQEINDAIISYLSTHQPAFVQPFMPETTKELSNKLCDLAGDDYDFVVFSNSGAETVEAAFKLARTKTKRSKILSATDSFHGKSFAALSATGSDRYSNEHTVCDKNFDKVPLNDIDALAVALQSEEYAAFIVEPVQGEGGMIPATEEFLRAAQELCKLTGTKLIFDEIQTGLGRTGTMFAKCQYGVDPDMILLSKALGGGAYPIGAMIVKHSAYSKEFDRKHSSTFASGGIGAKAALKTLEILETSDVMSNVRRQSELVEMGLSKLQEKFPDVISFDGKGLMWAIDFSVPEYKEVGNSMSTFIWETALSYIISGFLLNEKQLLCTPFLGKVGAVRFEPSLTINEEQVATFLQAIEDVCTILQNQRHDILFSYLIGRSIDGEDMNEKFVQKHMNNPPQPALAEGETRRKFAFLCHLLSVDDTIMQLPPAVRAYFSIEEQSTLSRWILGAGSLEPETVATQEITMTSATGETVTGMMISATVSPEAMMKMSKLEKKELMDSYLQQCEIHGVDHIVGLGAFTAVITRAGTQHVNADNQPQYLYTTGSSFTALASAESLKEHAGSKMSSLGVSVIGAKGTVGRLALMELLQHFGTVNVIGNPRSGVQVMEQEVGNCIHELIVGGYGASCDSSSSLGKIAALLEKSQTSFPEGGRDLVEHLRGLADRHNVDLPLEICTDATSFVHSTDYVLTATSEGKAFLSSDAFNPGTVVFDLARPFDFEASPENKIEVFEGGLVNQPEKTLWGDSNIAHHPPGVNLACLSETIALAMEGVEKDYSIGSRIPFSEAKEVYNICVKHGFSHLSYGTRDQ